MGAKVQNKYKNDKIRFVLSTIIAYYILALVTFFDDLHVVYAESVCDVFAQCTCATIQSIWYADFESFAQLHLDSALISMTKQRNA